MSSSMQALLVFIVIEIRPHIRIPTIYYFSSINSFFAGFVIKNRRVTIEVIPNTADSIKF